MLILQPIKKFNKSIYYISDLKLEYNDFKAYRVPLKAWLRNSTTHRSLAIYMQSFIKYFAFPYLDLSTTLSIISFKIFVVKITKKLNKAIIISKLVSLPHFSVRVRLYFTLPRLRG